MEPAYPHPDGSYTIARDGDLQQPLTDPDGIAYLNSKTGVGGADKVFDSMTENLNNTGSALIVIGYLLAISTDGASLGLVGVGESISTAGTVVSATHDVLNGKIGSAVTSMALDKGISILGSAVKDSKSIESTVSKTVLRATISANGMIADKLREKVFAVDHEEKKNVIEQPKIANTKQNKVNANYAQSFFKQAEKKKQKNN